MNRARVIIGLGAAALTLGGVAVYSRLRDRSAEHWALVQSYCVDCHSAAEASGGLVLEGLAPDAVPARAEVFEAVARKLRGRLMPPPGGPQPEQEQVDSFVAWLEGTLDDADTAPRAGHVPIQRLNRTEYAAAIRDLVGVEIDAAEFLPAEIEVDGFNNIAAALSTSPAFLEQYLRVARHVAHQAVGEPHPKVASVSFPPPGDDQDDYVDGMPLGTRGGVRFTHNFLADGEYRVTITDLDVGLYPRSLESEHTLVMLVDRNEVFRAKLGGREDLAFVNRGGAPARAQIMERFSKIPVPVTAGVHEIAITFIERARANTEDMIAGFTPYGGFSYTGEVRAPRVIGGIEVEGPFGATGLTRTASRDKIFVCTPSAPSEERACAERITTAIARRAFRRDVDEADLARLLPFYEAGRASGSFDTGIEQVVTAVLASPDFLYRAIPPGAVDGDTFPLDGSALASRLSFFLWSQGPDDELLALAAQGKLDDRDVLEEQVERMLADPRARALVTGFALRWLNVDELEAVTPDERLYPEFSAELRQDFATEIELFVASVLLENRDVRELLTADYTFVNERLARHYGLGAVRGPQFRRVAVEQDVRRGLLGKGAVLLRTSYGDRTSPVLRGAWVLEKLMGTPPAPPPPNVETDLSTPAGEKPTTVRARLEQHRADPVCAGCHGVIDPYGLALENFTATGHWRDRDEAAGVPIDATTQLPGGKPLAGPVELTAALVERPDQFVLSLTHKLMMYAVGRELEYYDMPQVRAVVKAAEAEGYRFSAIVAGIVRSDAFRKQGVGEHGSIQALNNDASALGSQGKGD
jgi:hypothetical protein